MRAMNWSGQVWRIVFGCLGCCGLVWVAGFVAAPFGLVLEGEGVGYWGSWFGPVSVMYTGGRGELRCRLSGAMRNPPEQVWVRFRHPEGREWKEVRVGGEVRHQVEGDWVLLPGGMGDVEVVARY